MKTPLLVAAAFLGCALSAFAQMDGDRFAASLREKYGPPLARETFAGLPGMEMVVDYGFSGHVCRIELPAVGPDREPGVKSTRAVDDFLAGLIPLQARGKELRRWAMMTGLHSVSFVEYANITIAESLQGGERTGVTVTFTKEECRDRKEH